MRVTVKPMTMSKISTTMPLAIPIARREFQIDGPSRAEALQTAAGGRVYALPTYTALLELREQLAARGHVGSFWAVGAEARRAS